MQTFGMKKKLVSNLPFHYVSGYYAYRQMQKRPLQKCAKQLHV